MNIQINGEQVEIDAQLTVTQLLADRKVKMPDMVSVELNGEILSRDTFDATAIQEGDQIEFLYFMGGGSRFRIEKKGEGFRWA